MYLFSVLHRLFFVGLMIMSMVMLSSEQRSRETVFDENISICDEIKELDKNFVSEQYTNYFKRLSAHNMSPCDCAKYLSNKKEQKALSIMEQEGTLTKEQLDLINDKIEIVRKRDESAPLQLIFDDSISENVRNLIEEKMKRMAIRGTVRITTGYFSTDENMTGTNREYKKRDESVSFEDIVLNVGKFLCKGENLQDLDAIIEHELMHIKKKHNEKDILFANAMDHSIFINNQNGYKKWRRAWEAQADRIPIACTECEKTSYSIWNFYAITGPKMLSDDIDKFINNKVRFISAEELNGQSLKQFLLTHLADKDLHPPYPHRSLWIHKIAWLKAVEARESGRQEYFDYLASRIPEILPLNEGLIPAKDINTNATQVS